MLKTSNMKVRFACAKGLTPTRDPLCMRKELIYEGRHEDGNGKKFTVTPGTIEYWEKAFNELNAEGMEIPAPITAANDGAHPQSEEDAQKNAKGTWLSFQKGKRPDGLACLNAVVKFKDEAAKEELSKKDISIFAENNYTGPNGKTYSTVITHAMFTDNPAIPGLSGFIACSRVESKTMNILEFCQSIELVGEEATEEEAIDALKSALVKKADADDVAATETDEPKDDDDDDDEPDVEAAEISDKAAKAIAAGRKAQIESLQASRKLDPKTAKEYIAEYTATGRVKKDIKQDNQEFDKVIIACSRLPVNESLPVPGTTRTGSQIAASKGSGDSPTVADAKKRREEADAKRRR